MLDVIVIFLYFLSIFIFANELDKALGKKILDELNKDVDYKKLDSS